VPPGPAGHDLAFDARGGVDHINFQAKNHAGAFFGLAVNAFVVWALLRPGSRDSFRLADPERGAGHFAIRQNVGKPFNPRNATISSKHQFGRLGVFEL
jgi:hypothetical protein